MKTHILSAILLLTLPTFCLAAPIDVPVAMENVERDEEGNTPLHVMAKKWNVTIDDIETLLESGADINARNDRGETPLHLAACSGANPEAAKYLIFRGADIHAKSAYGAEPLLLAPAEIGRILIAKGANVNTKNDYGWTPLHNACMEKGIYSRDSDYVRFLLGQGVDADAMNYIGETPLLCALDRFSKDDVAGKAIVRQLIRHGADVNVRKCDFKPLPGWPTPQKPLEYAKISRRDYNLGLTPVHYVIQLMPEEFPLCVEHGANLDMVDEEGNSLMHHAARHRAPGVIAFLAAHCGNVDARNHAGETPLHLAVRWSPECVPLLLWLGADIDARDNDDRMVIHHALRNEKYSQGFLRYFHRRGLDLHVVDEHGQTLLHHMACGCGNELCIQYVLDHGLDINARDAAGNTPLHLGARKSLKQPWMERFIALGADIHARNDAGQTLLHMAAMNMVACMNIPFLIDQTVDIHARDAEGRTVLHFAAQHAWDAEILEAIIAAGADPHVRDNEGRTAMYYVGMRDFHIAQKALAKCLINHGLDINAQDNAGNTPLHEAARRGELNVQEMLKAGADASVRNNAGELPEMPSP